MPPSEISAATPKKGDPWYFYAIMSLVFFALAMWTNSDLKDLESGATESVKLWVPLVWTYNSFGRLPTVGIIAAGGVACVVAAIAKVLGRK